MTSVNLKSAVQDVKAMQDFKLESLLMSSTAESRFKLSRSFIYLCLLLAFAFSSCGYIRPAKLNRLPPRPLSQPVDAREIAHVINTYAVELKHDKHLFLEDSSVEFGPTVNRILLEFSSQDILELCEVRALIVDVVEELLDRLNSNPSIFYDEYLATPITADNLEIYIDFQSFWGRYGDYSYISWLVLSEGLVYYYDFDIKISTLDHWHSRVEHYSHSVDQVMWEREGEELYQETHHKPKPSALEEEQHRIES